MDRRGSGFKKIIGDYREQPQFEEAMKPEFNSDYDQFLLILRNLNYKLNFLDSDEETIKKIVEKTNKKNSDKTIDRIVAIMMDNPGITAIEIAEGVGITVAGVRHHIRTLKASGRIERVGADRGGYWKVNV